VLLIWSSVVGSAVHDILEDSNAFTFTITVQVWLFNPERETWENHNATKDSIFSWTNQLLIAKCQKTKPIKEGMFRVCRFSIREQHIWSDPTWFSLRTHSLRICVIHKALKDHTLQIHGISEYNDHHYTIHQTQQMVSECSWKMSNIWCYQ
jgi:hypothetical protein